jgi:outer membrane protein OmpA-like peptidoglycan-associated protein
MNTKVLILFLTVALGNLLPAQSVKSSTEVDNALYPEKQNPPAGGVTPGKTRGRVGAGTAVNLTETTRSAVISGESQRALTRGRMRGKILIKPLASASSTPTYGAPPAAQADVQVYKETMASFSNILFKLGSTEFADDTSRQQVSNIATALKAHADDTFVIEGHTCDLGEETKNQGLSLDRAQAVANHLMRAGVKPEQVVVLGFGETDQLSRPRPYDSPEQAERTRAPNRRVAVGRVAQ